MPKKKKIKVTEDKVIQELAKIAFDSIDNYISYSENENGEITVKVKDSQETDIRSVAEIKNGKSGFQFKMYNK